MSKIYSEEFFRNKKIEVKKLQHFLQECKYSGTIDGKIDFNVIIQTISSYDLIIDNLRNEIKNLENRINNNV